MRTGMVEAVDGVSVCFTCQQVGHITRFCPMRMGQAVSDSSDLERRRQEDKRRRADDRDEFLHALSEISTPRGAAAKPGGALPSGQPEAKLKKALPAFLAVKKRRA